MNGSKRKNRLPIIQRYSSDNRAAKGKSVHAQGVYNNTFFMHAATALVGNIVQVHVRSGNIYEGVFRTFSPNFDVALELPFCIKSNINSFDEAKPVPNFMIFTSDNVVSIVAKEFDSNFATSGTFQTDTAISEKNALDFDEKELEPWDSPGINGEVDCELEQDANGWDANDMFTKNKETFGVQSTFDDSLSDYTVQIDKRETDEFKEAEAKAEKIAEEIENNPLCRERLDLENGDEEALFAAVERPAEQNKETCNLNVNKATTTTNITQTRNQSLNVTTISACQLSSGSTPRSNTSSNNNNNNSNNNNNNTNNNNTNNNNNNTNNNNMPDKYIPITKRKTVPSSVKPTRLPTSASTCVTQESSNNAKLTSYQTVHVQGTTSFNTNPNYSPLLAGSSSHKIQANMSQSKLNGDVINTSVKNTSQRIMRPYATPWPQQTTVSKAIITSHNQNNLVASTNVQENPNSGSINTQHIAQQSPNIQGNQPPLSQRQQIRSREEQIQDLRKFQQDFHLSGMNSQQSQHQVSLNINKNTNTHQVQQSLSPQQPALISPHGGTSIHSYTQFIQSVPIHHLSVKPTDANSSQSSKASHNSHSSQSQDKSMYQNNSQPTPKQTSPVISPGISISESVTPSSQLNNSNLSNNSNNSSNSGNSLFSNSGSKSSSEKIAIDKMTPKSTMKKTHVLNPSAPPFTPRNPSTPTSSRPHTPQTPVQSISGMYSAGSHVGNAQPSFYLMHQQTHPNLIQPPRLRRGASHIHVAAATGQPLLTTTAIPQLIHYQQAQHPPPFPSQQFQPVMRMFHEPTPQSIQFVAQTPPSTTPSPGQQHQPFHPPPQASPAGGAPQTSFGTTGHSYQLMCPVIHPSLLPSYYHQGAPQNPQYQILMSQHPAQ